MEERAARAAEALGHLDAHHAKREHLFNERRRHLRLLVHFARRAAAFPCRQTRTRCRGKSLRRRPTASARAWRSIVWLIQANVIIAGRACASRHSRALAAAAVTILCGAGGCARIQMRRQPSDTAKRQSRRNRSHRLLTTQPVFRTGINIVRVDVIVTDRQGNPVTDLKLEDFDIQEDGKPQKAETFRLVKIDTLDAARLHATHHSHAQRRRDGRRRRELAHLRFLPGRLSRPEGEQHVGETAGLRVHRQSARAERSDQRDAPVDAAPMPSR